ncbi:hypothetical protein Poli38472_010204 [Pythium oligandrum]|uniref:Ankyrin repeat-containing domain n=1 Tax=Pythium oligandrum TaxID=41045 RepID=A0A8K1C8X3_PYTOL|nr:hypothetical protein Poli38472_010204 [Pythium oligandrum]|eukprot:TMW58645.1 hypothetical protein Poli38472_010204 [Pythium oligandrum]
MEELCHLKLDLVDDRQDPVVAKALTMFREAHHSLTDLAIETNDMRSLEMVYELRQQWQERGHPCLRFYHAMRAAALYGRLEMLNWLSQLYETHEWLQDSWLLDSAIQSKDGSVVQWVMEHYRGTEEAVILSTTLDKIAGEGALDVLQLILDRFPDLELWMGQLRMATCKSSSIFTRIGQKVHLDVVRYVFDHGGPTSWHRNVMDLACATSLEHAKLFHECGAYGCSTGAMDGAAANGHLETVRFLHEHRFEGCSTAAMDNAATHGYLEVIQLLHEHHVEGCTFRAMDNAAAGGHLDVVKFLHKNRDEECSKQAMNVAAGNGHLQVVKFLHVNRSEGCSGGAVVGAAAG